MTRIIRGARESDFDAIRDLERMSWPGEKCLYINDPWFHWDQFRIAEADGRIVSMLKILRRAIAGVNGTVVLGGIGSVSTHPDYRGRGHSGAVLQDAVTYMERNGYELSMLFSALHDFYARYGWRVASHQGYRTPLRDDVALPTQGLGLRRFDVDRDIEDVNKVYRAHNRGRPGVLLRTREYWRMQQIWTTEDKEAFVVAPDRGKVIGYLRGKTGDKCFVVLECAYDRPCDGCVDALAAHAIEYARKKGRSELLLLLPQDNALVGTLQRLGLHVGEEVCDSMMLRVIAPEPLAHKFGLREITSTEDFIQKAVDFHFSRSDGF